MSYIRMSLWKCRWDLSTGWELQIAQTVTLNAKRLYDDVTIVS